jgi:hypothetical protein
MSDANISSVRPFDERVGRNLCVLSFVGTGTVHVERTSMLFIYYINYSLYRQYLIRVPYCTEPVPLEESTS